MKLSEFKQLIREEVRKVMNETHSFSRTKIIPNAKKQLGKAYGKVYDYGDNGLEKLDSMADEWKLTKVAEKYYDENPISDLEASQLLQLFNAAADEMKWYSED